MKKAIKGDDKGEISKKTKNLSVAHVFVGEKIVLLLLVCGAQRQRGCREREAE